MEKPRIVEKLTHKLDEVKLKIGAFIVGGLERFDDALDVPLGFDEDEERLATEIELELLTENPNIFLGED